MQCSYYTLSHTYSTHTMYTSKLQNAAGLVTRRHELCPYPESLNSPEEVFTLKISDDIQGVLCSVELDYTQIF